MISSITKIFRSYRDNISGVAGVEFALVAVPFLLTIFGIMEMGRAALSLNSLQYVVEETSRYAALNSDLTEAEFLEYAESKIDGFLLTEGRLSINTSSFSSSGIDFIEIEGGYRLTIMIAGLMPADWGEFDLESTSRKPIIN